MDILTGSVERITYYNPENGYSVVRLRPDRGRTPGVSKEGLVTVTGNLPELSPGEHIRLSGQWSNHPKHGLQFKVEICEQDLPATVAGIRRYLGSGLIKGIGPRLAERIVDAFGAQTLEVIEHRPQQLREVPDIGPKRAGLIARAWQEQKQVKEIMLFLHSYGVSTNLAIKIYKQYGDEALGVVKNDPYRLARDIFGVGFKTADRIAQALGLPADHPSRVEAGLIYALNKMTDEGHVFAPQKALAEQAIELLGVDPVLIPPALERLARDERVRQEILPFLVQTGEPSGPQATASRSVSEAATLYGQNAVYLAPLYWGETGVAERLRALASAWPTRLSDLPPAFVPIDPNLSPEQQSAIRTALSRPVSVLTGGPGTGKCILGEALVWTDEGLIPIKELVPVQVMDPDTALPISVQVKTRYGLREAKCLYYGGCQETVKILTSEGYELEGTPNHQVIVASPDGMEWKRLDKVSEKDFVAIMRADPDYEYIFDPFAYLLGLFTGDGNVNRRPGRKITGIVITSADPEIWAFLEEEMPKMNFTVNVHSYSEKAKQYYIGRRRWLGKGGVVAVMEAWGCKLAKSREKTVPTQILRGSLSRKRSFLSGLFDTDGTVDKRDGSIILGLSNLPLLKTVQIILLEFGITATLRLRGKNEESRLSMQGEDARLFYERIGFRIKRKQELRRALSAHPNTNRDLVPCLGSGLLRSYIRQTGKHKRSWWWKWKREVKGDRLPHRNRILALLNQYSIESPEELAIRELCDSRTYWARVDKIERNAADVFDLYVPQGNEFIANGFVNHNTYVISTLTKVLDSAHKRYALASPTGRAARRLSEATGRPASTIHRLLAFKPGEGFQYNAQNPLPVDLLVVDEASMLDLLLANNLLKALQPGTHLLLVGDVDQLPSVGAGDVLRDVIASELAPVTRLSVIFRQAAGSQIITNAHRINQGLLPAFPNSSAGPGDFYLFPVEQAEEAGQWVEEVVCDRIPKKFGLHPRDEVQVLAPMYRGPAGVHALNERLQARLNPPGPLKPEKRLFGVTYRLGDKVMQVQNNYDKDVFNGDIGTLVGMNITDQTLTVEFEGRRIAYDWLDADQLVLAYSVSVHKAQGSEFPAVVVPLVTAHYMMLQRNLLYTAITRAKRLCVLVGSRRAISMAVRNNKVAHRYTALDWRLKV